MWFVSGCELCSCCSFVKCDFLKTVLFELGTYFAYSLGKFVLVCPHSNSVCVVRFIFPLILQSCTVSGVSNYSTLCILHLCLALCVCDGVSQSELPGSRGNLLSGSDLQRENSPDRCRQRVSKGTGSVTHRPAAPLYYSRFLFRPLLNRKDISSAHAEH